MYFIYYTFFYLLSLLPWFILYGISDFIFLLLFHVFKYRRAVVASNLEYAFPEKSIFERRAIERAFYKNLSDSFVETIKLFSISKQALSKRVVMDLTACEPLLKKGKNIHFHTGHQMNWEYGNFALIMNASVPAINVYLRLNNKIMDRVIYGMRTRFGGHLVSAQDFQKESAKYMRQQYVMGLIADQSPAYPQGSLWLLFFGKPTAFIPGPDKGARRLNPAVVFLNCVKVKRGHYRYESLVVAENGNTLAQGELILRYRDFLEKCLRERPDNYLWSHRRWKAEYQQAFEKNWIDTTPPPAADLRK